MTINLLLYLIVMGKSCIALSLQLSAQIKNIACKEFKLYYINNETNFTQHHCYWYFRDYHV